MMIFGYLVATGVTTGALYALIALGIVVVFRATNIVNFSHGEMFMLGGFMAWTAHVTFGLPYPAAFIVAALGSFLLGLIVYHSAFRPLVRLGNLNAVLLEMIAIS